MRRLQGLQAQGVLGEGHGGGGGGSGRQEADTQQWLANPALPDDILQEAVPGNIRRAGAMRWRSKRRAVLRCPGGQWVH